MIRLPVKLFVERSNNVDFIGDDGKAVHIDRVVAFVQFPETRFPVKMVINRNIPAGDYDAMIVVEVVKDKLSCNFDLDSIVRIPDLPPKK